MPKKYTQYKRLPTPCFTKWYYSGLYLNYRIIFEILRVYFEVKIPFLCVIVGGE